MLDSADEPGLKKGRTRQLKATVGADERTFAVRLTREGAGEADVGLVLTFDDITELVSAQRTSAWADVARRIAHEIKNPLTPIQLSTDRLRSKYGKQITEDRDKFDGLIDTISRRVGDIKTMVDEFAAFARVPKPVIERDNLSAAVQEAVVLFRESHPKIEFVLRLPDEKVFGAFDRRLVTQAVTNLVKNATEAVESGAESMPPGWKGQVETILRVADDRYEIDVIDNGIGLPKQNRSRLLEPYVTTKGHKGTGLGLAIVQKITEQHGGALVLDDAPQAPGRDKGALVRIVLPRVRGDGRGTDTGPPSESAEPATAARRA
jgi:two-component system nitrogen regulation sensor histidine kinase NtrY